MNTAINPISWRFQTSKHDEKAIRRIYVCDIPGVWKEQIQSTSTDEMTEIFHHFDRKFYTENSLKRDLLWS